MELDAGASAVFHRDLTQLPPRIVRGQGVYLWDAAGKRYLDAVGGAAVAAIGHGVAEITEAVGREGAGIPYTYGATFTHPWQEGLASRLLSVAPAGMAAVYLVSGGSEANETAIKMARQYFLQRGKAEKFKVLSRWHSFHGVTLGTLALSGRTGWRRPFEPYLHSSPQIVPAYPYRRPAGQSLEAYDAACAADVERAILREGPDSVAAVIVESISGTSIAGSVPGPGYHPELRRICDRHDVLMIVDEVLCGFGRTGRPFAIDHWGVTPDIITCGKAIGSGYAPLGAAIASEKVVAAFRAGTGQFTHGFTYSGHPLSCFIGCQVFDYVQRHGLFGRVAAMGEYLFAGLAALATRRPSIGDVRGKGLLAGIELVADRATKQPFPEAAQVAARIVKGALAEGLLVIQGTPGVNYGLGGDQLQLTPPYTITEGEVDEMIAILDRVIARVEAEVGLG